MRLSVADEATDRRVRYRLHDIHAVCPPALELYLHPDIFKYVELIFDQAAVAFQSLYFAFSAEQSLHRDPIMVRVTPKSHMLAACVALEDIHHDSGPLMVVPGSHRIPYY